MMDVDRDDGYGYSVWFVPSNYKELQARYNITHIPHITLETNLSIRDAFHIYHNACSKIKITFQHNYVKFPSLYHHDPMISYGWFVNVEQMTRRKLNWTPHMTLRYISRQSETVNNIYIQSQILSENHIPPTAPSECFVVIADTRSGIPEEWHMKYKYFNIKASQGYTLSFDLKPKYPRNITTSIDDYFGTCLEDLPALKNELYNRFLRYGIVMNDNEIMNIMKEIEKQLKLVEVTSDENMDIDAYQVVTIR